MNFRLKYKKGKYQASKKKKNRAEYVLALEVGNNFVKQDTKINNHKR